MITKLDEPDLTIALTIDLTIDLTIVHLHPRYSVSRSLKPFGEHHRPQDWFSQKNCALQYAELLENVETPK